MQGRSEARIGTTVRSSAAGLCLALTLFGSPARGQDANLCDIPGEAPDLIVGDISSRVRWGNADGITAFSFGVATCNPGTCWANWMLNTPEHPVIGQNLFRLANGRFEQIGQSWLFHEFFALSGSICSTTCVASDGAHLGTHCSNPDIANYLGLQSRLGPKFEVDPSTGVFPFPATDMAATGGPTYKRVQVHDSDLDPALNPGAHYFVELQIVSHDDAATTHQNNNASYREVLATNANGAFDLVMTGATVREHAAIEAWRASDPSVELTEVAVPDDGRMILGAKVTPSPAGWHYEYALQNLNARRSAQAFSMLLPAGAVITNAAFHDVDYHSGEPFALVDWTAVAVDGGLVFETEPYAQNPNANALRWGTLYNFRFDCNVPPAHGSVAVQLFRPGTPQAMSVTTLAPSPCGVDSDGDARGVFCDCDDANALAWSAPGEARALSLIPTGSATNLTWIPPADPGASAVTYDLVRSAQADDFGDTATCVALADPSNPAAVDASNPPAGDPFFYLVRAKNACPGEPGSLGTMSNGAPRQGRSCP